MKPEEKVTCPFCGAEIDPDAIQCPSCGNEWSDSEEREVIRSVMKIPGMGEKRTKKLFSGGLERIRDAEGDDLLDIMRKAGIPVTVAEKVKDRLETRTSLHLCPECGAFVPATAEICPICGADLSAGEEEIDFTSSEVNDVSALKDDLFLDEVKNLYLCRVCGAFINESHEKCPVCGAPMPENRADMPVSVEDKLEDEERNLRAIKGFFGVKDPEKLESVELNLLESVSELDICSECGAFVRPEASRCPVCGAELVAEVDEEEEREVTDEALSELEALANELIGSDIEAAPVESEYICSGCGSPVPEDAKSCPVCGTVFEDDEESGDEIVLSLDEVLSEESVNIAAGANTGTSSRPEETEDESDEILPEDDEEEKERMKEEVDLIFAPVRGGSTRENREDDVEREELARVLEGGMDDEISPPEMKEEPVSEPVSETYDVPADQSRWNRAENIAMASSAIGASLLASEYLLTNGVTPNPLLAYGTASLSIFIPILVAGLVLVFLDRERVFRVLWLNGLVVLAALLPAIPFILWFTGTGFPHSTELEAMYLVLYVITLLILWKYVGERLNALWVWLTGMIQIVAHSLIFVWGNHPWIEAGDMLPSYLLAMSGGAALAMGIYIRIDAELRSIMSTRDVIIGHRHYMEGNYEEAMKYYSRAIDRRNPYEGGYDLAYYSKGTALLSAGKTLEALKYLNRTVKENPNNEMAWNNRGIALSKLGLDEGALASYDRALRINPDYDVAWNNRGNVLARMGRYREALECYDRAIKLNPDYKDAWMNKGYVLIKLDRYDEAKECADRVLRPEKRKRIPEGALGGPE